MVHALQILSIFLTLPRGDPIFIGDLINSNSKPRIDAKVFDMKEWEAPESNKIFAQELNTKNVPSTIPGSADFSICAIA